jgi:putative glutamine amidotransferase
MPQVNTYGLWPISRHNPRRSTRRVDRVRILIDPTVAPWRTPLMCPVGAVRPRYPLAWEMVSETRPTIGIVAAIERARYGLWDTEAALLPLTYTEVVRKADGFALMIPPDPELVRHPDRVLDQLDGLMLAGGADINPANYGQPPHPETKGVAPLRDEVELALTRRAIDRDMPVLGICRGMQLLNVACGGTLVQHLPDLVGHGEHRRNPGSFDGSEHDVVLDPGSVAARAAGEEHHVTRSHHHQGVDVIGEGLVVSGRSTLDDLPEAIEAPGHTYVLGVQWHPEADENSRVVASFVDSARAYRARRLATGERSLRRRGRVLVGSLREGAGVGKRHGDWH